MIFYPGMLVKEMIVFPLVSSHSRPIFLTSNERYAVLSIDEKKEEMFTVTIV